ncbi:MAG TPA: FTR1 family protein, partial [Polyangiaceae bacterium]
MKSTFNIRAGIALLLFVAAVVLGVLAWRGPAAREGSSASHPAAATDAQHLVSILQYLESDYPAAVASHDAGELAEQRSFASEALSEAHRVAALSPFLARVTSVDARVREAQDADGVSRDCASLVDDVVTATGMARAPSAVPDLAEGATLFAQNCSTCHGASGHGDGPAAAALTPKPADFHSAEAMGGLTPFKAFNVVRFGVKGTAMAPFTSLDEKQRWALAFYVFTLRQPACTGPAPRASLDSLANRTDEELGRADGEGSVACLRRTLPQPDAPSLVAAARARVEEASHRADQGDARSAESALLDAYLTDIEPIEPWLRARDAGLVTELEASFTETRAALQAGDPSAREDTAKLLGLLDRAAGVRSRTEAASVFGFSLLVIVREGFEAAVVIAALLAVVKKRKQLARARLVHAGWISALAVGAVAFVAGRRVLAGAMNEKLEGILALVATAMLLHAALWLNARTTTRKTMGSLRERTKGALDRGALALFGIAFLAMFRESFETAVFLEALSIDAPSAVVLGALTGTVLLLGLVFAVGRLGLRLPMVTLFKISTVVLVVTAVVLLGQGIHSLEEVGLVPSRPMPFFRVEFLGLFPDRLSLLAQAIVALAPLAWWATRPRVARGGA